MFHKNLHKTHSSSIPAIGIGDKRNSHQHTRYFLRKVKKSDCTLESSKEIQQFLTEYTVKQPFQSISEILKTDSSQMPSPKRSNHLQKLPTQLQNQLNYNKLQIELFNSAIDLKLKSSQLDPLQIYKERCAPKYKLVCKTEENKLHNEEELKNSDVMLAEYESSRLKNLKVYWYTIQISNKWKPSIRESASLAYVYNKCYLYGGIGRDIFNSLVQLDLKQWKWEDLGSGSGDIPGRFGHSAVVYKKNILFYGGERKYNNVMKMRECYQDIKQYNPTENTWSTIRAFGDVPDPRRNHTALICGKYMFVIGGVNAFGQFQNDVSAVNLENLKWIKFMTEGFYNSEGIAFTASVAYFKGEPKFENPYMPYETVRKRGPKKTIIKSDEGIYLFGGRHQDGKANNNLMKIKLGVKPLQCQIIETKGQGPTPRYMHSMNYVDLLNICVIYGGRDDNTMIQNIHNDLYILGFGNFQWVHVKNIGIPKQGRCNHSTVIIGSKILIFGGYDDKSFCNSDLLFIEMDQSKIRNLQKEIKYKKTIQKASDLMIFQSQDINDDLALRIFTADNFSQQNFLAQQRIIEPENQKSQSHKITGQMNSLISYQPLPYQDSQSIVQDYKLTRDQGRSSFKISTQTSLERKTKDFTYKSNLTQKQLDLLDNKQDM